MFKFKSKKEVIGTIMGMVCYVPMFIIYMILVPNYTALTIIVLSISQGLWVGSIYIYNWDLRIENEKLKNELKNIESN